MTIIIPLSRHRNGVGILGQGAYSGSPPLACAAFWTGWQSLNRGARLPGRAISGRILVRDLRGHKTLAMTGRYVERTADPMRALADQVSNRIAAAMDSREATVLPFEKGDVKRDGVRRAG